MDILQQNLKEFWSRDTLICERVIGSGSTTPPGVEFWRTKIRFYPAGHQKKGAATINSNCRVITLWCENKVFESTRILDGLLDTFGARRIQGALQ